MPRYNGIRGAHAVAVNAIKQGIYRKYIFNNLVMLDGNSLKLTMPKIGQVFKLTTYVKMPIIFNICWRID